MTRVYVAGCRAIAADSFECRGGALSQAQAAGLTLRVGSDGW
jgi:hypothetical protein